MNCRKLQLGWRVGEVRVVGVAQKSADSPTSGSGDVAKVEKPTPNISTDAAYRNSLRTRAINLMKGLNGDDLTKVKDAYSKISNENDKAKDYLTLAFNLRAALDSVVAADKRTKSDIYWDEQTGGGKKMSKLQADIKEAVTPPKVMPVNALATTNSIASKPEVANSAGAEEGGDIRQARAAAKKAQIECNVYNRDTKARIPALIPYFNTLYKNAQPYPPDAEGVTAAQMTQTETIYKNILAAEKQVVLKYDAIKAGLQGVAANMLSVKTNSSLTMQERDAKIAGLIETFADSVDAKEKGLLDSLSFVGGNEIDNNRMDLHISFQDGFPQWAFVARGYNVPTIESKVRETAKKAEIEKTVAKAIADAIASVKPGSGTETYQDTVKNFLDHALRNYTPEERALLANKPEVSTQEEREKSRPFNAAEVVVSFNDKGEPSVDRKWVS